MEELINKLKALNTKAANMAVYLLENTNKKLALVDFHPHGGIIVEFDDGKVLDCYEFLDDGVYEFTRWIDGKIIFGWYFNSEAYKITIYNPILP